MLESFQKVRWTLPDDTVRWALSGSNCQLDLAGPVANRDSLAGLSGELKEPQLLKQLTQWFQVIFLSFASRASV